MTRRLTVLLLLCTHFSAIVYSADRGTSTVELVGGEATVQYGRPQLGGRDMLGKAKPGMVWRLGMNQTTTLTTEVDLMFGSSKVAKGVYSLLAECTGVDSWNLIVSSEPELRGPSRDPGNDVGVIPLKVSTASQSVEVLTISLNRTGDKSGDIAIEWGNRKLEAAFKTAD